MIAPSVLLPCCANWSPGKSLCDERGTKTCGECKLVVVSTQVSWSVRITWQTDISIVMPIVKRPTGQNTRKFVDLRWLRSTGAPHGIVKAEYHLGRAGHSPETGIMCLEAANTCGEILQRWMYWILRGTRASATKKISPCYLLVSAKCQSVFALLIYNSIRRSASCY